MTTWRARADAAGQPEPTWTEQDQAAYEQAVTAHRGGA